MKSRSVDRKTVVGSPAPDRQDDSVVTGLEHLVRGWDRFWFTPADSINLGLIRIIGGLLILYVHLSYSFDLLSYVGHDQAWVDAKTSDYLRRDYKIYAPAGNWTDPAVVYKGTYIWSIYHHVQDPFWIYTIHYAFVGVILLFIVGLWTRVATVLTWFACLCYLHRATTLLFGMDAMLVIFLFYMMIAPCGAYFSLDRWLEVRRARKVNGPDYALPEPAPSIVANVALRGMQIHFCFIYMASGLSKLLGPAWWNGTALWYCYANWSFAPLRVGIYYHTLVFLCQYRWLWEIVMSSGVLFTLFTELGFPFLVWLPRWRWFMVGCAVLLHTGIGLFMGLVTFSMFMLCLLASFIPPMAIRHLLKEAEDYLRSLRAKGNAEQPRRGPGLVLTR